MNRPRRYEVLDLIKSHYDEYKFSPTNQEMADTMGLSSRGSIARYVSELIEEGLVISNGGHRGLVPSEQEIFQPYLGTITAGGPLEGIPEPEKINLYKKFNLPGLCWLRANQELGDSMLGDVMKGDAGIVPGDYVGYRPTKTAPDNAIVIALIDGKDNTLKRLFQTRKHVELRPDNDNYKSLFYEHDRVEIQGIVLLSLKEQFVK